MLSTISFGPDNFSAKNNKRVLQQPKWPGRLDKVAIGKEPALCLRSGHAMVEKRFKLSARISSDNPSAIKPVLERIIGN